VADRVFLDTNVVLYAEDERDRERRDRAVAVLAEIVPAGRAVISTQVLQEFYSAATRKLRLTPEQARRRVVELARLDLVIVTPELTLGAIDLARLHGLSFWDALIVRCAAAAGCGRVLTEDLNHGQEIDGVRIENPFASGAMTAREAGPRPRRRRAARGRAARR
jgi:predicted nucleic acid-binding protein